MTARTLAGRRRARADSCVGVALRLAQCPRPCRSQRVTFVTFDVYGTLIDWENGVYDAFAEGGRARRLHARRARRSSRCSTRSSARSRAAPTSSTPRSCAAPPCGSPRSSAGRWSRRAPASCPTRSSAGRRSRRPTRSSTLRQEVQTGLISNIDDKLLGPDAPALPARLRPRRHGPAGALLQARSGALQGVRAAHRHQEGLGPRRRRATTTTSSRASRRRSR